MLRKRRVAIHMIDDQPTMEGLLRSYWTWRFGRHYVLDVAELVVAAGQTQELQGRGRVRIPRERVAWVQEL